MFGGTKKRFLIHNVNRITLKGYSIKQKLSF